MVRIDFLKDYTFSAFDVETTGLNPYTGDRICEIGLVQSKNGKTIKSYQTLIDPLRPIAYSAYAVNGISNAMVKGKPHFGKIAKKLVSMIKGTVMVCHNAQFDLKFLQAECLSANIEVPSFKVIDTLLLARRCYNFERNNLGLIAAELEIKPSGEHRALADAETTLEIFKRFASDFKDKGIDSLDKILELQRVQRKTRPAYGNYYDRSPQLQA